MAGRFRLPQRVAATLLGVALCACGPPPTSEAPAPQSGPFTTRSVPVDGAERTYALYLPEDYDPKQRWPLVVFLHGWGERGDDGLAPTTAGLGPALRAHPDRYPAVVILPQMPKSAWSDDVMNRYSGFIEGTRPTKDLDAVVAALMKDYPTEPIDAALADAVATFSIDPDRLYLTGLSMGGFGSFHYAALHPERFAAVLPVCGGADIRTAPRLAHLPFRIHHGGADDTVAPKLSRRMVGALKRAGAQVIYEEYPKVGHNSWDRTYSDPEVAQWLFAQQRGAKTDPDPEPAPPPPAPEPEPEIRYPFHEPLPAAALPRGAPAMRYANLSPAQCRAEVKKRALPVQRDGRPTPGVATALRFTGPIHGVTFVAPGRKSKYGVMDCRLALTLADLAEVLAEHDIDRVVIGTIYRPGSRLPRSRRKNSQHAHGLAADVVSFRAKDGQTLSIERDWHGEIGAPSCGPNASLTESTDAAIALRNLTCDIARRGFFHFMLTPNYDRAHHDHLHLDIKRDAKRGVIR